MPFLTVGASDLSGDDPSRGFKIFFAPPPEAGDLPSVWLDLHISGEFYQACEDELARRAFATDKVGARYVIIRPSHGVRLFTAEAIGLDCKHTAVIVNVAGRAKHGLIVAPGKIDPGFPPKQLVLVVFNQSNRRIRLNAGDKVACIAFAEVSSAAKATESTGHIGTPLSDFQPGIGQRLRAWLSRRDFEAMAWDLLKIVLASLLGGWIAIHWKK